MIYWLHSISFLANIVAEWHQTDHATIVLDFFQSFASSGSLQVCVQCQSPKIYSRVYYLRSYQIIGQAIQTSRV